MATQQELVQSLNDATKALVDIGTEVDKVGTETGKLNQTVIDLQNALANQQNLIPEVSAAFDALKAQVGVVASKVKTVDDLVPDAAS